MARGVVEGFITGLHDSPYKGFSVEFAEHRKYSPGDNPRHLDWRILGRTDRLYIKQYEEETNLRAQILLDMSGSMSYGEPPALTKLQYASYLTAVLAYFMIRQQDAVGLTAFDTEIQSRYAGAELAPALRRDDEAPGGRPAGPEDGPGSDPPPPGRPIQAALPDRSHQRPLRGSRRGGPRLHHFRSKRHEVIVFHVLDRAEIEFPFGQTTSFVDMETGERIQVDPAYVRDDYRRQIEQFLSRHRRICAECQFDYVLADTSVPYDYMLSRYLEKRTRL